MKTTITFIAAFLLISQCCSAQTKPKTDTVKKPQWVFNGSKPVTFTLNNTITLTASDLDAYIFVLRSGGPDAVSKSELTGKQITAILSAYSRAVNAFQPVVDSLNAKAVNAYNAFIKADKAAFSADTAKHRK